MGTPVESGSNTLKLQFGSFELDPQLRTLTKAGRKIALQQQPFQILHLLLTRPGQIVSRDEIRQALWPGEAHGQFDASLANAIRKIRIALDDDVDKPRFIETLPRQGFSFIAPVTSINSGPEPNPTFEPPARNWLGPSLGFILAVGVAMYLWQNSRPAPPSLAGARPLAALGGRPTHPALSMDGQILAFEWQGPDDDSTAIYLQRLEESSPQRLTSGKNLDFWPVWSPNAKHIAFFRELLPTRAQVHLIPVVGVGDRVLFEVEKGPGERPRLNWSHDGKWLVTAERKPPVEGKRQPSYILLYSMQSGQHRVLTTPESSWRGDSEPVFSPDASEIAFRRTRRTSGDEDIFTVPLQGGEPKPITAESAPIAALDYTPDHGLLFSSRRGVWLRNFWWIPPGGGKPQRVSDPAFDLGSPTISRDGRHIAFVKVLHDVNIWRLPISEPTPLPFSPSEFIESNPSLSPDGSKIAFVSSRSGALEIWTSSPSGADTVQLTSSGGSVIAIPAWSPDGKTLAFEWRRKGQEGIYLMPSSGGIPKPLLLGARGESFPRWSRDGKSVYFNSDRSGRQEIWRIPVNASIPSQITTTGGCGAIESPDASMLFYARPDKKGIWASSLSGSSLTDERLILPDLEPQDCGNWDLSNDTIYYIKRAPDNKNRGSINAFHIPKKTNTLLHSMKAFPLWSGAGLAVSPDGKSVYFASVDRDGTSIYGR